MIAPVQSMATSPKDEVREGTKAWWNSSPKAKSGAGKKARAARFQNEFAQK
jgi:hypothetical protein